MKIIKWMGVNLKTYQKILNSVFITGIFFGMNVTYAIEPNQQNQVKSDVKEVSQSPEKPQLEQPAQPEPNLLTSAEIQKALTDMKNKMNLRIDEWGNKLTRKDFERIRGKLQLKENKQLEVCNIFQGVINETYQLAQANKQRLTPVDQKLIEKRSDFIKALGFKDNIVNTNMGFDCLMQ